MTTAGQEFSTGVFARITGKVQGVNYRASTRRQAEELGLIGWVRNTSDGAVELLLGGDGPAIDALLRWCHHGPPRAQVSGVETRQATTEELETLPASGFSILR
ncbi:acylphosphatase [Nesterenkonia alba]|uniref:acylphosphatase n=1 Tax=Nesterenkonia alba TaxID=515814 RepID=UPI0003B5BBAE|nr:acylphosphatase [Nesterenkonia alba]